MTEGNKGVVEIDVQELTDHRGRMGPVFDRVATASDAARETIDPAAFGVLGAPTLGVACTEAQAILGLVLNTAADATDDHLDKLAQWAYSAEHGDQEGAHRFGELSGDVG